MPASEAWAAWRRLPDRAETRLRDWSAVTMSTTVTYRVDMGMDHALAHIVLLLHFPIPISTGMVMQLMWGCSLSRPPGATMRAHTHTAMLAHHA